jgi:hypothetical protein
MKSDHLQPLAETERRIWVRPSLKRIDAGSAENDAGPRDDAAVNIS